MADSEVGERESMREEGKSEASGREEEDFSASLLPSTSLSASLSWSAQLTPGSRQMNSCAEVDSSGCLDLSGHSLDSLSAAFFAEYSSAKVVDLSHNRLRVLPHAKQFSACRELRMARNELRRLSSLLPLSLLLHTLDVSSNCLNDVAELVSFHNLRKLLLAGNKITDLPLIRIVQLVELDISSNLISSLPPLSHLSHLRSLNLSHNSISSLALTSSTLPSSLRFLNLSSNCITYFTSFFHLCSHLTKLESLSIMSIPCVSSACFNHRPFLFALLFDTLREVDGRALSESEQIQGEMIAAGKLGRIKRGGEAEEETLREYLAVQAPLSLQPSHSPLEAKLAKVVAKRREYLNESMTEEELSIHSPFSNWHSQLFGKENVEPPSTSVGSVTLSGDHDDDVPHASPSSTLLQSQIESRTEKVPVKKMSPVLSRLSRSLRASPQVNGAALGKSASNSPRSQTDSPLPPHPLPRSSPTRIAHEKARVIQVWWRQQMERRRRMSGVGEGIDPSWVESMERRLGRLEKDNQFLKEVVCRQTECIEKLYQKLPDVLKIPAPPVPGHLKAERQVKRQDEFKISWTMPLAEEYEVEVDEKIIGRAEAPSQQIILTAASETSRVRIRSLGGGVASAFSRPLSLSDAPLSSHSSSTLT